MSKTAWNIMISPFMILIKIPIMLVLFGLMCVGATSLMLFVLVNDLLPSFKW